MAGELRYHYTSVEALFEIVERKRFRISNILFMNDYFEFRWLWRLVQEQITERQRCDPEHRSNLYLKHIQSQMDRLLGWNVDRDGGIVPNVFCGCFSIKDNDLNQWRQYADDGRGVVIGVDLASVISENERCDKRKVEPADVTYKKDEQLRWVAATLDEFINHAREYDVETEPREEVRVSNIIQTSLGYCMELATMHRSSRAKRSSQKAKFASLSARRPILVPLSKISRLTLCLKTWIIISAKGGLCHASISPFHLKQSVESHSALRLGVC